MLVFVATPSEDELRRRLAGRGTESDQELEARLSRAAEENERQEEYDHVVVNDDLEKTVAEITGLVELEIEHGRTV